MPEETPYTKKSHEVSTPIIHYKDNNLGTSYYDLPARANRGIPPKRYSPNE